MVTCPPATTCILISYPCNNDIPTKGSDSAASPWTEVEAQNDGHTANQSAATRLELLGVEAEADQKRRSHRHPSHRLPFLYQWRRSDLLERLRVVDGFHAHKFRHLVERNPLCYSEGM